MSANAYETESIYSMVSAAESVQSQVTVTTQQLGITVSKEGKEVRDQYCVE